MCLSVLGIFSVITLISASHPDDFLYQSKGQCYYRNGTEDVRLLIRLVYNQEEYVYFDSDKGFFIPVTEYGRPSADYWNNNPDELGRARAAVETVCKYNYPLYKPLTIDRKSEPKVKITNPPSTIPEYETVLTCFVDNFFPFLINVTWLKNGVEEPEQVTSSELLDDGDWTYQIHVHLSTTIHHGDTFTCRVEHSSLSTPLEVHWKYETPESARNKKLTGIVGFVLGSVFFLIGLIVYLRYKKGVGFLAVQQENPMS